jgi:hypothetical protein
MSEELIKSLNSRISELEKQKDDLHKRWTAARHENKSLKATLDEAVAERDEFAQAVTEMSDEHEALAAQANAGPEELTARIKELEGSIAARDYKDTFKTAALKSGVHPDKVDDLLSLSGLKPGDEPAKPEDFADFLSTAKEARSWAFAEASQTGGQASPVAATPVANGSQAASVALANASQAIGSGRSVSDTSAAKVTYSLSEVARSGWQKSRPELQTALANSTAVCVGE